MLISESLKNKSSICREECDNCNDRFCKTIEPDIANMLSSLLTIYSYGKRKISNYQLINQPKVRLMREL